MEKVARYFQPLYDFQDQKADRKAVMALNYISMVLPFGFSSKGFTRGRAPDAYSGDVGSSPTDRAFALVTQLVE